MFEVTKYKKPRMRRVCRDCQEKFIPKTKGESLCEKCWRKARMGNKSKKCI